MMVLRFGLLLSQGLNGHESPNMTAGLYVIEVPDEVRRTQERYADEIDNWKETKTSQQRAKKKPASKRSA